MRLSVPAELLSQTAMARCLSRLFTWPRLLVGKSEDAVREAGLAAGLKP